jgi:hypothetical protein
MDDFNIASLFIDAAECEQAGNSLGEKIQRLEHL